MTVRDRFWPYALATATGGTAALVLLDIAVPAVLAFAVVGPGMALVRLLRLPDIWAELLLAIVVSLCIAAAFATVSIYLEQWNPRLVLLALVGVTVVALVGGEARGMPRP